MTDLKRLIERELPGLTALRHDLHAHPELSYEERRTSSVVQRELTALGIEFKAGLARGTGVVGYLPATGNGSDRPSVAMRADMDALPITEQTGKPYASTTPGVMHACGHDGHTTILLGAARVLARLDDRPNPVTFIFQPAEEGGGGGEKMCDEGALLGSGGGGIGQPVGRIYGLHGWPGLTLGSVATRPGPLLAATDEFEVIVRGEQCHAAYPHLGCDPVLAASHIVTAAQSIVSRSINPADAAVVTFAVIEGGAVNNVIPESVRLVGTVRTLSDATRALARERFHHIVATTASAMGCVARIDWHDGYPVTRNDPALAEHVLQVARDAVGPGQTHIVEHPTMGGEDFSYFGQHVPACFYLLGLQPPDTGPAAQLHQPHFDFNDDAIPVGVEMMCRLAVAEPNRFD